MATNIVSGSRLSVPPSTGRDNAILPEQGAKVYTKGAKLRLKDALMRMFGVGWKNSDVEGEVIAKPQKNTRRFRWNIGGQFYESEHGAAFWRKAKEHRIPLWNHQLSHNTAGLKLMKRTRASIMMPHQCVRTKTKN